MVPGTKGLGSCFYGGQLLTCNKAGLSASSMPKGGKQPTRLQCCAPTGMPVKETAKADIAACAKSADQRATSTDRKLVRSLAGASRWHAQVSAQKRRLRHSSSCARIRAATTCCECSRPPRRRRTWSFFSGSGGSGSDRQPRAMVLRGHRARLAASRLRPLGPPEPSRRFLPNSIQRLGPYCCAAPRRVQASGRHVLMCPAPSPAPAAAAAAGMPPRGCPLTSR